MSIIRNTIERINDNRYNKHNCIPFDDIFPKLSDKIPGIQRRYYIISGASGAGKSQLTDHIFVFNPFDFVDKKADIDFNCVYYSFEMDKQSKMQQWINRRLYQHYGIRININILQSAGKNRLTDDLYSAVLETEEYFERMEDRVKIIDSCMTPSEIAAQVEKYAASNGKVEDGRYIPNHSNKYFIIIVDHVSLLNNERGMDTKHTIEKLSSFFVHARNHYGFTPVAIQQQAAAKENVEHFKTGKMEPSKDGLGESKLTYNDCDLAFGIFSPYKHELKSYRGYNIGEMKDCFRSFNVFKNRYGESDVRIGLYFDGAVGYFKELPRGESMNSNVYDMINSRKPNW